jgi:hypothetical protein
MKIRIAIFVRFSRTQHTLPIQAHSVISSEAEGAVEKSLDFICLVTRRHQDPPNLHSRD